MDFAKSYPDPKSRLILTWKNGRNSVSLFLSLNVLPHYHLQVNQSLWGLYKGHSGLDFVPDFTLLICKTEEMNFSEAFLSCDIFK